MCGATASLILLPLLILPHVFNSIASRRRIDFENTPTLNSSDAFALCICWPCVRHDAALKSFVKLPVATSSLLSGSISLNITLWSRPQIFYPGLDRTENNRRTSFRQPLILTLGRPGGLEMVVTCPVVSRHQPIVRHNEERSSQP
jgi:hypothetical protein